MLHVFLEKYKNYMDNEKYIYQKIILGDVFSTTIDLPSFPTRRTRGSMRGGVPIRLSSSRVQKFYK